MPDFKKLLTTQYLFQIDRLQLAHSDWLFLYIGGGLVVLGILLRVLQVFVVNPVDSRLINRLFKLSLITGLGEAVWFAARYQNIMFFGTHFVALLILFLALVWLLYILVKFLRSSSTEKQAWQKEQLKLKYLNK